MKTVMLVLAILWTIAALVWWGVGDWMVGRDTDKVMDRAQVAADATDMLGYMEKLRVNMDERGMTQGSTALVFKTDVNDVSKQYEGMKKLIQRLEKIKNLDTASTTYQVALDDIRGTIRELPRMGSGWYWVKVAWILLLVTLGVWIVTGLVWAASSKY